MMSQIKRGLRRRVAAAAASVPLILGVGSLAAPGTASAATPASPHANCVAAYPYAPDMSTLIADAQDPEMGLFASTNDCTWNGAD